MTWSSEMASDLEPQWNEFEWMGALSRETSVPPEQPDLAPIFTVITQVWAYQPASTLHTLHD